MSDATKRLARDHCGDNHHPHHIPPGKTRFDVPELCDHCTELADAIDDAIEKAVKAERDRIYGTGWIDDGRDPPVDPEL